MSLDNALRIPPETMGEAHGERRGREGPSCRSVAASFVLVTEFPSVDLADEVGVNVVLLNEVLDRVSVIEVLGEVRDRNPRSPEDGAPPRFPSEPSMGSLNETADGRRRTAGQPGEKPSAVHRPLSAVRRPIKPAPRSLPSRKGSGRAPKVFGTYSPIPPHPHTLFPARPPAERPRRDEVATHAVTNRTGDGPRGDRAALGRAGPEGSHFPSPPAQTVAIRGRSTNGSQKCAQVRLWHSSCGPKELHMRTMHRATAETGFRLGRPSPRCALCKLLF